HRDAERIEHDLLLVVLLLAEEPRKVLAGLEIRVVAVVRRDVALAIVDVAGQLPALAEGARAGEREQREVVPRLIGAGEDRAAVDLEQLDRCRAVADQIRVGEQEARVQRRSAEPPAEVGEKLRRLARRVVAPAVLLEAGAGDEIAEAAVARSARFRLQATPAERAARQLGGRARVREAVLRLDRDRAAERVQPEQRIGARLQRDRRDRRLRDQRPADRVAERLVHSNAVLIYREPLRQAEQRRADEAAVLEVGLERIVLRLVHEYAGEAAPQVVGEVEGAPL